MSLSHLKSIFYNLLKDAGLEEHTAKEYVSNLVEIRPYDISPHIVEFIVGMEPTHYLHFIIDIKEERLVKVFGTDFFHS